MTTNILKERWATDEGTVLAEEVLARLISNRPLQGLGLNTHQGLIDLRCFTLPTLTRLARFEHAGWFIERLGNSVTLRSCVLEGIDFSGAILTGIRFHDSTVRSCRFDKASCRQWRLWGTSVADCSFARATLRDSVVGSWHDGRRNEWIRVGFEGADFRVAQALAARFTLCDFSLANLSGVRFEQCDLQRCRFAGVLKQVTFDGRVIEGRPAPGSLVEVSFNKSVFSEVEFLGVDLTDSALPQDLDLRVFRNYACIAREGIRLLGDEDALPQQMLRAVLANRLEMSRPGPDDVVFNRRDYLASGGEELAALALDVLESAEKNCTDLAD